MEVRVEDELTAANDLHAVDRNLMFASEINHLGQRGGVDSDLFGRGDFPMILDRRRSRGLRPNPLRGAAR